MPAKRRRYTGQLAKPIAWPASPTFWGAVTDKRVQKFRRDDEKHQREAERLLTQQLSEKMKLLLEHFGITDHDLTQLAWALAFEHVPGFQAVPEQKSTRGRKKEWDGVKLKALFDAVQEAKTKHLTDRQALKFLSTNAQFTTTWGR